MAVCVSLLHCYTHFQEAAAFPWTQEGSFRVLGLSQSPDTRTGRGGRGERSACLPAFFSYTSICGFFQIYFSLFVFPLCPPFLLLTNVLSPSLLSSLTPHLPSSPLPFLSLTPSLPLPPPPSPLFLTHPFLSFPPSLPPSLLPFLPPSLPPFLTLPSLPPSEPSQFSGGGVPSVSSHTHSSSLTSNGYRGPHQHSGYVLHTAGYISAVCGNIN